MSSQDDGRISNLSNMNINIDHDFVPEFKGARLQRRTASPFVSMDAAKIISVDSSKDGITSPKISSGMVSPAHVNLKADPRQRLRMAKRINNCSAMIIDPSSIKGPSNETSTSKPASLMVGRPMTAAHPRVQSVTPSTKPLQNCYPKRRLMTKKVDTFRMP